MIAIMITTSASLDSIPMLEPMSGTNFGTLIQCNLIVYWKSHD